MKHFLTNIINSIKSVILWVKIIIKDRSWDPCFTYQLLQHKLELQLKAITIAKNVQTSNYDVNRIKLCIRLLKKLNRQEYDQIVFNQLSDYDDFKFSHRNILTHDPIAYLEAYATAQEKHAKARRILFKLLDKHLENWWY